jgi:hypothetical protein
MELHGRWTEKRFRKKIHYCPKNRKHLRNWAHATTMSTTMANRPKCESDTQFQVMSLQSTAKLILYCVFTIIPLFAAREGPTPGPLDGGCRYNLYLCFKRRATKADTDGHHTDTHYRQTHIPARGNTL